MPLVGEALVRLLSEYEVDTVFGIPGVHNVELYRSLEATGIRHILARHEQGAGFMADGYARVTRKPGICFVISGPGLTNVLTALGQAYSDSVSILAISSVIDLAYIRQGKGRLHEMRDQEGAAAAVTRWSRTAYRESDVAKLVAAAFESFAMERPRPIHIQIPVDLLQHEQVEIWPRASSVKVAPPAPEHARLSEAAAALLKARRPVLIAGGGAIECGAAIKRLASALNAGVATTIAAKGLLEEDHPMSLGSTLSRIETQRLIATSDVVVAVGTELAETDFWVEPDFGAAKVVRIDIDPCALQDWRTATIPIHGDAKTSLEAIAELVEKGERPIASGFDAREILACREAAREGAVADRKGIDIPLKFLREALPDDAILVTDMTELAYLGNKIFPVGGPLRWLHPAGFGTLGYALPAAIGAKIGAPAAPVVAIAGDFGFQYTIQELGTAVENNLNIPIIIWNNESLLAIKRDMQGRGIAPVSVEARNPDFVELAKAYGAYGARPETIEEFKASMTAALGADRPTIIELRESTVASSWSLA